MIEYDSGAPIRLQGDKMQNSDRRLRGIANDEHYTKAPMGRSQPKVFRETRKFSGQTDAILQSLLHEPTLKGNN